MTEITKKNWYDAKNYDREKEYKMICARCGHISEMHEWDDYEGETCIKENCSCTNFVCKVENNLIVYDGEE